MSAELFHSVRLDPERCVGCTTCIKHCPTEAIRVRDGRARIIEERCTGCRACAVHCPADAITGEKRQLHTIDPGLCIKCGNCRDVCRFDAVLVH